MATSKKTTKKSDSNIDGLQHAIVTGLEDIKAVDIRVFDTEHISALFERVIIASGNSNRQTRALASSVLEQVKEAGFPKPRIEGEDNGEWIIVDCGMAVCHIMQPVIRSYYHLEDIWGEKPVKSAQAARKKIVKKVPAKTEKAVPAKKAAAKKSAGKTLAAEGPSKKPALKKAPAKKTSAPKTAPAQPPSVKTAAVKTAAVKTAAVKTTAAKKTVAKKTPASKPAAKKAPSKKASKA